MLRDVATATSSELLRPYDATLGTPDDILRAFLSEVNEVSREAEVERILSCFKLNPYEHLSLRFDSAATDVKRQYRKVRLL